MHRCGLLTRFIKLCTWLSCTKMWFLWNFIDDHEPDFHSRFFFSFIKNGSVNNSKETITKTAAKEEKKVKHDIRRRREKERSDWFLTSGITKRNRINQLPKFRANKSSEEERRKWSDYKQEARKAHRLKTSSYGRRTGNPGFICKWLAHILFTGSNPKVEQKPNIIRIHKIRLICKFSTPTAAALAAIYSTHLMQLPVN